MFPHVGSYTIRALRPGARQKNVAFFEKKTFHTGVPLSFVIYALVSYFYKPLWDEGIRASPLGFWPRALCCFCRFHFVPLIPSKKREIYSTWPMQKTYTFVFVKHLTLIKNSKVHVIFSVSQFFHSQ